MHTSFFTSSLVFFPPKRKIENEHYIHVHAQITFAVVPEALPESSASDGSPKA